jgi:secreted PhoX family phosphatase
MVNTLPQPLGELRLYYARKAAHLMGASPMDSPDNSEISPVNNKAHAILSNNT